MSVDVKWAVLCDKAELDQHGKLSIFGIFDVVFAPAVPALHPKLTIVFRLECNAAEYNQKKSLKIILMTQDGRRVLELANTLHVGRPPQPRLGVVQILDLEGVIFPETGAYQFDILIGGDSKYQIPLIVTNPEQGDDNANKA